MDEIINTRNQMLQQMYYMPELYVVIYENPEGSPRPRARFIKGKGNNILSMPDQSWVYPSIFYYWCC